MPEPAIYECGRTGTDPVQMYGWTGTGVARLLIDASGSLCTVDKDGMIIPQHDKQVIDESSAPTTTTITYSLSNVTVATKTISVSGTTTTIEMAY